MKTQRDHRQVTRRDKLFCAANRMAKLPTLDAGHAWFCLAERLHALSEKDIPKFDDLYRAIRGATVEACHKAEEV